MGDPKHDGLAVPGQVVLAHEQPFWIGPLRVEPATRQVASGDVSRTLEPRVMQVLVALYQAGRIVTRDELIERCWAGRVVGDDAINRVISRLRQLAGELGGGSFVVETIARVGYRLVTTDSAGTPASLPLARPQRRLVDRRLALGAAGAAAALGIVGGAWWQWADRRNGPTPRARSLFDQAIVLRQENNRQAMAYLREAVRLSPEFGQAWGALALSYRFAIEQEAPERVAGFEERLREAARNAERYDPGNDDAAIALLPVAPIFGHWAQLEPVYRRAIASHPGHAGGYSLLGTLLMEVGRWSDAVKVLTAAKARGLSSPLLRYKLIVSLWSSGQISAAEDEIDQAMQLWPQHGAIWQTKIKLLALTGRPRQALALASDPAARPLEEKDAPDMAGRLVFLRALATRAPADIDQALAVTTAKARQMEAERLNMALQAVVLGRAGFALDILEGVFSNVGEWAEPPSAKTELATHPLFQPHARPLWDEPRFSRILATVGLEDYWRLTGTLPDYRRA